MAAPAQQEMQTATTSPSNAVGPAQPTQVFPEGQPALVSSDSTVEIPKHVSAGQSFMAKCADGQLVQLTVPAGHGPGDVIPLCSQTSQEPQATVVGIPIAVFPNESADASFMDPSSQGAFGSESVEPDTSRWGWSLFALGWITCCCLGPFGPICWFGAWLRHQKRPKDVRALYPKERAVARLSCCTGLSALFCHIAVDLALVAYWRQEATTCRPLFEQSDCLRMPLHTLAVGTQFQITCSGSCGPARCYSDFVYGGEDGVYSEDSLICGAALASGIMQEGKDQAVVVTIVEGQSFYGPISGSNGMTTGSRVGYSEGFTVSKPLSDVPAANITTGNRSDVASSQDMNHTVVANVTDPEDLEEATPSTTFLSPREEQSSSTTGAPLNR